MVKKFFQVLIFSLYLDSLAVSFRLRLFKMVSHDFCISLINVRLYLFTSNILKSPHKSIFFKLFNSMFLLSDVSEGLSDVSERLADVSEGLADVSERLSDVSEGLADVSERLSDVSERLSDVSEGLADVSERLSDVSEGLSDVSEGLSDVSEGLSDVSESTLKCHFAVL